jgi:hypothetical protein
MTKNITFKRDDQCCLVIPYQLWREALRLAQNHDWEPEGTMSPWPSPYEAPWDGAYEWACGQSVGEKDAKSLAFSLQTAIEMTPTLIDGPAKVQLACLANFCDLGFFTIAKEDH